MKFHAAMLYLAYAASGLSFQAQMLCNLEAGRSSLLCGTHARRVNETVQRSRTLEAASAHTSIEEDLLIGWHSL